MEKTINFKVKRISDGRYRCFSDEFSDLNAEGKTEWEALTAARKAVRQLLHPKEDR
jgi:hypothetical protein